MSSTLSSALAALCLLGTSCAVSVQIPTPVPPTPTLIPAPTQPPRPTLVPSIAPTATPLAALPLRIGVEIEPRQPAAGEEFVLRLTVSNAGARPAHGVYIATSGPWDRYTVLSVQPDGRLARDANGWHVVSPVMVPPGSSVIVEVRARADDPSDERLTFAVREADPGELS